jgi:hypothetical protein
MPRLLQRMPPWWAPVVVVTALAALAIPTVRPEDFSGGLIRMVAAAVVGGSLIVWWHLVWRAAGRPRPRKRLRAGLLFPPLALFTAVVFWRGSPVSPVAFQILILAWYVGAMDIALRREIGGVLAAR